MRRVQVHTFEGPLDLLLQLIEQEQLDISQISLAKVTEEYIAELQRMEELPVGELAEFLVVAAKLLVIKSRLMVPGQTDEDDAGADLERQLKLYQTFVAAAEQLGKRWNRQRVSWPRDGYASLEPIFNPPQHLTVSDLRELYAEVLHQLEPIIKLPQTVVVRTINIRQKIEQVKSLILQNSHANFHDLLRLAGSKTEAIVTFLAVLELIKQRTVEVEQDQRFGDMRISITQAEPAPTT